MTSIECTLAGSPVTCGTSRGETVATVATAGTWRPTRGLPPEARTRTEGRVTRPRSRPSVACQQPISSANDPGVAYLTVDNAETSLARDDPKPKPSVRSRLLATPLLGALVGGYLFWILSLWPTLLPRSVVVQATVSAVCAAIGWMLGTVVQLSFERVAGIPPTSVSAARNPTAWRLFGWCVAILTLPALVIWSSWQNAQRAAIGLESRSLLDAGALLVATPLITAILVLVGRLLLAGFRSIDRRAARFIPDGWARAVAIVVVVAIVMAGAGLFQRRFIRWADGQFGALNETTADGLLPPTLPTVSGSPASVIGWETLGHQGRTFVATATTAAEIEALAGSAEPLDPIRIYVGLDSAPDAQARAALVIEEMERTGAFDRDVLVVATATGTGWINPAAAAALEYIHGGDTAIVSQQYSFFPSWIAFLVDPLLPPDTGRVLFNAVHERWSQLPADDRPRLAIFGESLGSYGAEGIFIGADAVESVEAMIERTDGALLIGPKAGNPIFNQIIGGRETATPAWRPALGDVPELRIENTAGDISASDLDWPHPRVLYVFHPTDGVGTWSPSHVYRPASWTQPPQGIGVPERVQWFPIVTFVQESADLMAGFSAEPGFGHDYTNVFVKAWTAILPPEDWDSEDAARIEAHLAGRGALD